MANAANLSELSWIAAKSASLYLVHVDAFAVIGMCERICIDWPSARMSLTRAGPTFFRRERVVLGRRWRAGTVASLKKDVPIVRDGLT